MLHVIKVDSRFTTEQIYSILVSSKFTNNVTIFLIN
jgi:hypothetical protein